MVDFEIFAGLGEKAFAMLTCSCFQLLRTGRFSELGRRSSYIMDISFEVFVPCKHLCFPDYGFFASADHFSALMVCERAETASAKAPAVNGYGVFD